MSQGFSPPPFPSCLVPAAGTRRLWLLAGHQPDSWATVGWPPTCFDHGEEWFLVFFDPLSLVPLTPSPTKFEVLVEPGN